MIRTLAAVALAAVPATRTLADAGELLRLDMGAAYTEPESPAGSTPASDSGADLRPNPETRFGRAGSQWWSIGPGYAYDFSEANDFNLHGIYSLFLADGLEFGVEVAGWYFNQRGDDTFGISGSAIFRWHFWRWDREFRWPWEETGMDVAYRTTVFADIGIGMLGSFDHVPEGGTGLNFLPRAGAGITHALTDDESGPRLTLGVRWHHISNARIAGDGNNPARDGLMGYVEIQFPF